MWLHLAVMFLYSFFFLVAALIVMMAMTGAYSLGPLLIAFNVQGIF
jgi:hypothetical protein